MNHSSLGGNNTINNSTNNINNYTQSNINTTNQNKIKERLIQNLKNNFNQERIRRKKMLSVNVNVNLNQHYSMIHNNINDSISNNNNNTNNNNTTTVNESISNYNTQSYYDNTNTVGNVNLYKRNYFAKKDQPLKLYTDANAFNNNTQGSSNKKSNNGDNSSSNSNCNYGEGFRNRKLINSKSNHNLSLSTNNNNNKHHSSSSNNVIVNSMETFYDLELKMDKMLKENKSNSKSKKYNITKMIFEEGIKQFTISPEDSRLNASKPANQFVIDSTTVLGRIADNKSITATLTIGFFSHS
jgi:transcriptional adapter 2-alpha